MLAGVMPRGRESEGLSQILRGYCPKCKEQVIFNTRFRREDSIQGAVYTCPRKECRDTFTLQAILNYQSRNN